MVKEVCGAVCGGIGNRGGCVRPIAHVGDHKSASGIRWAREKATKATMPGMEEDPEIARLRKMVDSMAARKTPEPLTMEDVIANIKDRLSVDVRVSRTGYEAPSNTVRVTLKWDNVAFSESSDTIPIE